MPRDFQRSRLYAWEQNYLHKDGLIPDWDRAPLTEAELEEQAAEVWDAYHKGTRPRPKVRVLGNRNRGSFCFYEWEIRLSRQYAPTRHRWYLLHELVHGLQADAPVSPHGPEFCRLYAELLGRFTGGTEVEILTSMRKAGLRVDARTS